MRSLRMLLAGAGITVVVLTGTGVASAHVEVQPGEAVKGEDTTLAFRVPNEEDAANVVELQVLLPAGLQDVSTRPLGGWTASRDGSTITWSGGQIRPGQFELFEIALTLPTSNELEFKAVQTYDNGDVVRWIDPTPAGGPEPEHPVPTLRLVAGVAATGVTPPAPATAPDADPSLAGPYALGAVALLAGASALVLVRRRARA